MRKKTGIALMAILLLIGNTFSIFASEDLVLKDAEKVVPETVLSEDVKGRSTQNIGISDEKISQNIQTVVKQTKGGSYRLIVKSGTVGTVSWTLDDAGVLTFGGGTFPNSYSWSLLGNLVSNGTSTVVFTAPVVAGTSLYSMFENYGQLTSITGIDKLDTSNVMNMERMFYGCSSLENLDLSSFDTRAVTSMRSMFTSCTNLKNLDVTNFDTSNVTNMSLMFFLCRNLETVDLSSFNVEKVTNFLQMFNECSKLKNLYLSNFNTSVATNMQSMFSGCKELASLDISNFDTSNVTNMAWMFTNCNALTDLDASSFNTTNVITMQSMFHGCNKLTNLDVSSFNTSNATNMGLMFAGCEGITNLDISNFATNKVTNMAGMFYGCKTLESLNISNFDTDVVTSMGTMFEFAPIRELTLGDKFRFKFSDHKLGAPLNDAQYSGNWELVSSKAPYTHTELQAFDGTNPGTYVWQRRAYNVTYESNGGTAIAGEAVANNSQVTEPANPTKAGYTFDGWYKEVGLTNQWNFVTDLMPANDVTLYAKWKAVNYQITYNLDGGTNSGNNPLTYEFAVGVTAFENPTKDGYKFLGWFESATSNVEITNIGVTEMGDKTLFARWEKMAAPAKPGTVVPTAGGAGTTVKYNKAGTKTGDEVNLLVLGIMLLSSAGYLVNRKKRRQNNG